MSEEKRWQFELETYIRQGEPAQAEKSEAWRTAIGLQAVDGLETSEYLLETAKAHIEGKINIDEAQKRIQSYYEERSDRSFHRQNGCRFTAGSLKVSLSTPDKSDRTILQKRNGC